MLTKEITLKEYAGNTDGTYDTVKVSQFLYYSTTGKYLSEEEAKKIIQEAKDKIKNDSI